MIHLVVQIRWNNKTRSQRKFSVKLEITMTKEIFIKNISNRKRH